MTPNAYDVLDTKPELVLYEDLSSLFQAMATHRDTHPGVVFVRADRPKERCIGFWDVTHQTGWHITLGSVSGTTKTHKLRAWCRRWLSTALTREELAAQLTQGHDSPTVG